MSSPSIPRLTLWLAAVALLTSIAGAAYTFWINPEVRFWKGAAQRKLEWCEKMRVKHGRVIGVVGGSSTTFGIDAALIEKKHGLPVANLGLHAGTGPEAIIGFGLAALEKGDTLIVSLEPGILTGPLSDPPNLGTQIAYALGLPEMIRWDRSQPEPMLPRELSRLQPGGENLITMLGKLFLGLPLYRYDLSNSLPGGLLITDERRDFDTQIHPDCAPPQIDLSEEARAFLARLREECSARGIQVAYLLPWVYSPPEKAEPLRQAHNQFLNQVEQILPVLREAKAGVHEIREDFADTNMHLTAEAAAIRSKILGVQVDISCKNGKL
jgi:hypothetical protein